MRHYIFRNQIEGDEGTRIRRALEQGPSPSRGDPRGPVRSRSPSD
jgi:hypothetical protein